MKVTAMIDDSLIKDAVKYSRAKSITEAVKVDLRAYKTSKKLKELSDQIKKNPLQFKHIADEIRSLNRD